MLLTHTHTLWGISLSPAVWWVPSSLNLEKKKRQRERERPVNHELYLWFSLSWTVIMHKTSNNHWFIFAFNYFLAQTASVCGCVCESMRVGPTKCTDRVLPPRLVRRSATKPQRCFCYVWRNKRSELILKLLSVVFTSVWLQLLSRHCSTFIFCCSSFFFPDGFIHHQSCISARCF